MRLITLPDKSLRKKAHSCNPPYEPYQEVVEELSRIRQENYGAGMAAPQIGVPIRMINIVYRGVEYTILNPTIRHKKGAHKYEESCLSVPDYMYEVQRPESVTLFGVLMHGTDIRLKCVDEEVSLVCHEVDHLDGILIDKRGTVLREKEVEDKPDKLAWAED